jgi:signal transduction histidine kinase
MRRLFIGWNTLTYVALGLIVALGYAMAVAGASLILGQPVSAGNPILVSLLALVVALGLNPVYSRLHRAIGSALFRGEEAQHACLERLQRELDSTSDPGEIAAFIRQALVDILQPDHIHVFLLDANSQTFTTLPSGGQASSQLRLPADGALAGFLRQSDGLLIMDPDRPLPSELSPDRAVLAVLGSTLYAPVRAGVTLTGWVGLGQPRDRASWGFTLREQSFIQNVARLGAVAAARSQALTDLRHRLRELDTLSHVAQAVNLSQAERDLLGVVGEAVQDLLAGGIFVSAVGDVEGPTFRVFARTTTSDARLLPPGEAETHLAGLLGLVIESGEPIHTDDYRGACLAASRRADADFHSWVGVPLMGGAECLGAIALGSEHQGLTYSDEHVKILAAVADQAASGLLRTRLYRQIEERAQQLSTLNKVGADLARTLELDPLLQQIMAGILSLVGCDSGLLALVDEDSGDFVVRVIAGGAAQATAGTRLVPDQPIVAQALAEARPIQVSGDDKVTGLMPPAGGHEEGSSGLVAVPLLAKGIAQGIILIRSKPGQEGLAEADLALLSTFAAQASIAIENARLYTLTDQALEAKVAELSVMQRIDRDLNASLDLDRALGITLHWAVEHTGALGGLVVIQGEDGQSRAISQGLTDDEPHSDGDVDLTQLPLLRKAFHSARTASVEDIATEPDASSLHGKARSLVAVPLQREARIVGGLYLEHPEARAFNDDRLAFLERLGDHASIAITNALLYGQVQSANLAKSEFISFISHELKTPMTSIKGYSDLLAQETVGTINQAQADFLGTIRSNADRMATLVSDLADISRIESGRLKLDFEALDVGDALEEVIRSARQRLQAKDHRLALQGLDGQPQAWADRTRLIQILANLVSNAIKYTPQGGEVVVSVASVDNEWDPKGAPRVLHISVADNGFGISEEERHLIFQKFFRSESPDVREAPGTGLGLSITKYLVELQGGQIWFESEIGRGTTFHFTMPLVEGNEPDETESPPREPNGA